MAIVEIYIVLYHSVSLFTPRDNCCSEFDVCQNDTMNDFKCLLYVCIYRVIFMFLKLYMKCYFTVRNLQGLVFFHSCF